MPGGRQEAPGIRGSAHHLGGQNPEPVSSGAQAARRALGHPVGASRLCAVPTPVGTRLRACGPRRCAGSHRIVSVGWGQGPWRGVRPLFGVPHAALGHPDPGVPGGLRTSRKSSHSSPKLQVISRRVGDLLRRSSTVAGSGVVSRPGACCFLSKWLASHSFPTARCHHRPMAGACKHTNKDRSLWGARSRFLTAPSLCWISHPRQGNRQPMRLLPRSAHNRWLNGIPRAWIVSFGD